MIITSAAAFAAAERQAMTPTVLASASIALAQPAPTPAADVHPDQAAAAPGAANTSCDPLPEADLVALDIFDTLVGSASTLVVSSVLAATANSADE